MKSLKLLLALTAVAALSFAYPASVQAVPTTYVYTGNPFTEVAPPYTTSMFVTGMLTLASPLAANMPLTGVTPLDFSFSDGVQTIVNQNESFASVQFATGPTGMITQWTVDVFDGLTFGEIVTRSDPMGVLDTGFNSDSGFGEVDGNPGAWSRVAAPDAGSTLALLSLSLTALGVAARQFKRAAA
jgi:hypothetical protein